MKAYIDNFIDSPVWKRLSILGAIFGCIVGGFYYLVVMPLWEEMSVAEAKVSDLQKEIQVLRVKASRLEEFEEEVEVLDAELLRALRELPDRKEMDTLLARISDKAKDSGLDVELFKPEGEIKRDFYAEVPVTLELRGEYHEIAGFFDEVAHLDRIVNMDKFNIAKESAKKGNSEGLKTTVVATSFRFLDESERPKEEDKKDGKRRGKKK
jgi:type IV pilus assembly protein PilO